MWPQSFAIAIFLGTYSLSSPLLHPVLIPFYWSLQSDIFFFFILIERFYTINYTTLNIFGDSYRLFSPCLQNPANHKNERAIRKEDDPPYSHRTGPCIFAGYDTKLAPHPHSPPPKKDSSIGWDGRWDLRTTSTPTPCSFHLSHFGNNTNTGFEGWKQMTHLCGFAEEKSLHNML